ncbi:MAG: ISAs1 family transposase [Thermomicrobiales bacterium]
MPSRRRGPPASPRAPSPADRPRSAGDRHRRHSPARAVALPGRGCPVHAVSVFCHEHGVGLAHEPIAAATGADTGAAELTVAPALLARIDWRGRVLTGDALFGQRSLRQQVRDAGGDYLVRVKANQGTLYHDSQLLFDPPGDGAALPRADRRGARTVETGHGRSVESRALAAATDLTDSLDWPGQAQVVRLARTWREHGLGKRALHYGITRLAPEDADPARLLALKRGHWAIENRLHRRKDVTLGEDASLIHVGQGPTVLALRRDAAVRLLHRAGIQQVAARLRRHSQHPAEAVAFVIGPLPPGA